MTSPKILFHGSCFQNLDSSIYSTVTELFKVRIGGFPSKFNDLCCLFFRGFVPFLNVMFSTMFVPNTFSPSTTL